MKRRFIINARAGRGRVERRLRTLHARFAGTEGGFDHVVPNSRTDTIEQTRRALHDGYGQIVAVGGDGTINAVLNGFFEHDAPIQPHARLTVADGGTGCDYARAVYGAAAHDWQRCVEHHGIRHVDIGRVRFLGTQRPALYFANMASLGLSAAVVQRKQHMPRFLSPALMYAVPAFAALFTMRAFQARVELDGVVRDGTWLNAFAAKGVTAGGGMRLGGGVALDDGAFDVTLIQGMGLLRSLPRFGRLFTGRLDGVEGIVKTRASRLVVSCGERIAVELDGEVEGTTDVEITALPRALSLTVPVAAAAATAG